MTDDPLGDCDRCQTTRSAERVVVCVYGCTHQQCEDCARATTEERHGG